jgi:hypothetical protein
VVAGAVAAGMMVGYYLCYVGVGADRAVFGRGWRGESAAGRLDRGHPGLALLCFLVFADNVASRIERHSHPEQWLRWEGGL